MGEDILLPEEKKYFSPGPTHEAKKPFRLERDIPITTQQKVHWRDLEKDNPLLFLGRL